MTHWKRSTESKNALKHVQVTPFGPIKAYQYNNNLNIMVLLHCPFIKYITIILSLTRSNHIKKYATFSFGKCLMQEPLLVLVNSSFQYFWDWEHAQNNHQHQKMTIACVNRCVMRKWDVYVWSKLASECGETVDI